MRSSDVAVCGAGLSSASLVELLCSLVAVGRCVGALARRDQVRPQKSEPTMEETLPLTPV